VPRPEAADGARRSPDGADQQDRRLVALGLGERAAVQRAEPVAQAAWAAR